MWRMLYIQAEKCVSVCVCVSYTSFLTTFKASPAITNGSWACVSIYCTLKLHCRNAADTVLLGRVFQSAYHCITYTAVN